MTIFNHYFPDTFQCVILIINQWPVCRTHHSSRHWPYFTQFAYHNIHTPNLVCHAHDKLLQATMFAAVIHHIHHTFTELHPSQLTTLQFSRHKALFVSIITSLHTRSCSSHLSTSHTLTIICNTCSQHPSHSPHSTLFTKHYSSLHTSMFLALITTNYSPQKSTSKSTCICSFWKCNPHVLETRVWGYYKTYRYMKLVKIIRNVLLVFWIK